jgi:hypothetical protein
MHGTNFKPLINLLSYGRCEKVLGGAGGSRSPGGLSFVLQRLVFVSSRDGTCFMSLLWLLKLSGGLELLENLWTSVFGITLDGALVMVPPLNVKRLMGFLMAPMVCHVIRSYSALVQLWFCK